MTGIEVREESQADRYGIEIRQASQADRGNIAKFIDEAYRPHARHKGVARWTWQFLRNPFRQQPDGMAPVWIAVEGDRVVGQIAVQEALLQVDGRMLPAGWIVDVMILPSHRGAGIGHRLYEAVAGDVGIVVTLTMADATRRMAERLGCITLGEVHQLTRWVRLDANTVRRYLMTRSARHRRVQRAVALACQLLLFDRVFPFVVNPLLAVRDYLQTPLRRPSSTTIVEVSNFGEGIGDLWQRARRDYPVMFARDPQFLNWRFMECPEPCYRCFAAKRHGLTVGYVVLRDPESVELPQGHIVDLYAARDDTRAVDDLVRHSLAFFGRRVAAVDCGTSIPEFEAVFRRHGFFRTRTHRPTLVCQDGLLRDRLRQLKDAWFFSKADHDWDQIHVAEAGASPVSAPPRHQATDQLADSNVTFDVPT